MRSSKHASDVNTLATEPIDPRRSALMARIRSKNSIPELAVRQVIHRLGYRFRLHRRDLPGTPDLVFPGLQKAIFVHGCFWHRHRGCARTTTPKTRKEFWSHKFRQNVKRDRVKERQLKALGWRVLVVWECETFEIRRVSRRVEKFLSKSVQP